MPKKAKRGRPPGKKKDEKAQRNGAFWRGVAAVGLIILGVVLLFGAFISAPIPHSVWHGFWWALGGATVVAPVAVIYLGLLKFINEDNRIPLPNMIGTLGLLVFLASWLHTAFYPNGHGGRVGQAVGNVLVHAMGKFLASLVFFLLTAFSFLFTFAIEPRSLLKLFEIFKREPKEVGDEDLGELKKKMTPDFQLHEGVPVEHHAAARMPGLRASAEKM